MKEDKEGYGGPGRVAGVVVRAAVVMFFIQVEGEKYIYPEVKISFFYFWPQLSFSLLDMILEVSYVASGSFIIYVYVSAS